jgi:hypothetical protein
MFEPKTFDQIFREMRDHTPPQISDFQEGSIARTLYETFAFEVALLYEQMHQVYLSAFVDTATGSQLDLVVAILGIKRGEPDFAMGFVTFERDLGIDKQIEIPVGFLVTTREDSSEIPKKAYRTTEVCVLPETESRVQVRVQAVQPEESQVSEANTVQVMPQPLPGIKAITNEQPIRFTGKRRETDEELRDRAKITLLAASGANISTIETTLISLPGVKEVRVQEPFHYARGTVVLRMPQDVPNLPNTGITIPRKTRLVWQDQPYLTQDSVVVKPGIDQPVRVEATIQGPSGQVTTPCSNWQPLVQQLQPSGQISIAVSNPEPISLKDFGVMEVFVDGVDLSEPAQVQRLEQEIDRVRAAGVYVFLKPTRPVPVDGDFLVELKPDQRFSTEERQMLERQLQEALLAQLNNQRLGQPLLLAQLTQTLLADKGITDLVDFELTVDYPRSQETGLTSDRQVYTAVTRRLEVEMMEKFVPRHIRVASEVKPLPIHIQMQVPGLNDSLVKVIKHSLQTYFASLAARQPVRKQEILDHVCNALNTGSPGSFNEQAQQQLRQQTRLVPEFWHPQVSFDGNEVTISLLERAELGEILLYKTNLEITGALQLIVPLSTTEKQQQALQTQVRERLQAYLEWLKPEESINLKQFGNLARSVHPVLDGVWKEGDFSVRHTGATKPLADRIKDGIIRVAAFEKPTLATGGGFVVATTIQPVEVLVDPAWQVRITGLIPAHIDRPLLKAALSRVLRFSVEKISTEIPQPRAAQSVSHTLLKDRVLPELLRRGVAALSSSTIREVFRSTTDLTTDLSLSSLEDATAAELADLVNTLLQTAQYRVLGLSLNDNGRDILVRIVERANLYIIPAEQLIDLELPSQGSSTRGSAIGGGAT